MWSRYVREASMSRNLYFLGTAGSGKSTMVYAFQLWMNSQGLDCVTVNLDPGAESLQYSPDLDVRDYVNLSEIMEEQDLGPNGAQVAAADMIAMNARELAEVLETFETSYILIDTPGQIELFTFRASGPVLIDAFGREDSALVYLNDPALVKSPSGFISSVLLNATVQFRHGLPFINVLSKADLLPEPELERIVKWSLDPFALYEALFDADFGDRSGDFADCLVIAPDEAFFDQVVPCEFLFHPRPPLRIIGSEDFFGRPAFDGVGCDLSRIPPGQATVQDPPSRERIDQAGRIARQHDPGSDGPVEGHRYADRARDLLDDLPASEAGSPLDQPVEILLGVRALPNLREVHPDAHVRDVPVFPKHPGIAARCAAPEVEVVEPRVTIDAHERVLQACVDVPRAEMGLEARPSTHLALEAVGPDDHVRVDVECLPHVLASRTDHASILPEERDRARLDHDVRAGFRGFARQEPIEEISFEDVPAFVPRSGFIEDERGPVGRDDARAVDLVADELGTRRQADLFEPPLRDAFPASDRRTDFGPLLDQKDVGAPERGVFRRGTPGRTRADDEDIDAAVHRAARSLVWLMR